MFLPLKTKVFLFACLSVVYANTIDNVTDLKTKLMQQLVYNNNTAQTVTLKNDLSLDIDSFNLKLNKYTYQGKVTGIENSYVSILFEETTFIGDVYLIKAKKHIQLSSDLNNKIIFKEQHIRHEFCKPSNDAISTPPPEDQNLVRDIVSFQLPDINALESRPQANGVIFLNRFGKDYTNAYWSRYGYQGYADSAHLNNDQYYTLFLSMSDAFAPLDLNITTSQSVYESYPANRRAQVIITNTSFNGGISRSGMAIVGGFENDEVAWCFKNGFDPWYDDKLFGLANACVHEVGHNLGLSHDTKWGNYYYGHGQGVLRESLWTPTMGNSHYADVHHFDNGVFANADNQEDDFEIMASERFGVGLALDEIGDDLANATPINIEQDGSIEKSKNTNIIETREDLDFYKFATDGGNIRIVVDPAQYRPNLDIELTLLDAAGSLIKSSDPAGIVQAKIEANLEKGTYYIKIDGVGYLDENTGYTDYGSRGIYFISGDVSNAEEVTTLNTKQKKAIWNHHSNGVDVILENNTSLSLLLYNEKGSLLEKKNITNSGTYSWKQNHASGIYYVKVENGKESQIKTIRIK